MSTTGPTPPSDSAPTSGPTPTTGGGAPHAAARTVRRTLLEYAFAATPEQILVSTHDAPSRVSLQVIVSPRDLDPVTVDQIEIQIPVGPDAASTLSGSLPEAVYGPDPDMPGNATPPWTIVVSGGTITITPSQGSPGVINPIRPRRPGDDPASPTTAPAPPDDGTPNLDDCPIVFTLPGIEVNTTVGTVGIVVSESAPDLIEDRTSYRLVKHPSDWPVTSFRVSPTVLHNIDQEVTLTWATKEEDRLHGKFELSIVEGTVEADAFKNPYTAASGARGVRVDNVDRTTTISLAALRPGPAGGFTSLGSTNVTVHAYLPTILENSYCRVSPSGRLAWLHWVAENASACAVTLDGAIIDNDAPTNTYHHGYLVNLADKPGEHMLTVRAYAETGDASDERTLAPRLTSGPPIPIPLDGPPGGFAMTPDGRLALIVLTDEQVGVLNVPTRQVEPARIPVGGKAATIACTPDGKIALVPLPNDHTVRVIDIARRPATTMSDGSCPAAVTFAPGGKTLLVASPDARSLLIS